ncbi:hypothetical protein Dip518_001140 [Parelusimicrobium proximum]|uniref:hypothetical protein n=1 Tax=Parelusimicrobium proximum TaxID=3228953 RepID=UPI003D17B5D9
MSEDVNIAPQTDETCAPQAQAAWYYQRWGLVTLFALVGPIAIPWIIKSPVIKKWEKWTYTIAALIITAALCAALWICYILIRKMWLEMAGSL